MQDVSKIKHSMASKNDDYHYFTEFDMIYEGVKKLTAEEIVNNARN